MGIDFQKFGATFLNRDDNQPRKAKPAPISIPIPAVAQIPAAVVIPLIFLSLMKIIPPPMKLIPLTIWAATLEVS